MPPCPVSLPGVQILQAPWEKCAKTPTAASIGPRELCVSGSDTNTDTKQFFSPKQSPLWRHLADRETEAQVRAGKVEGPEAES